ncbi:MAG: peptidase [Nitrososphaerota archaeon]
MTTPLSSITVEAQSSNPNLFVSAENSFFGNHFFGSMVVEVVIRDSNISDTDEGKGEPDVTLNGKTLRMVQASDGNWYAYFANKEKAQIADATQAAGSGEGLDFGAFCGNDTPASVFGISFSDTDGVAIPVDVGISGATQGTASLNACSGGPPASSPNQNNVVRQPRSPNSNPAVSLGQIGIAAGVWPFIQLFSFNDNVSIIYNKGGGSQRVDLSYSDIPNISLTLDRTGYPKGAEVFVTIRDMQLNQDPTSVDSWTFNINSPRATFYQALAETGANAANGGSSLVDLNPHLGSLGFEKNGNLGINLGSVAELKTNQRQPVSSVTNGMTSYTQIVTLVESEPNSGIFESFDFNDKSTIRISSNAPRGQSASIEYNSKSTSIVAGSSTASLLLGTQTGQLKPGQKVTITLIDSDQNLNPGAREDLDVFRSSAIIPTLQIGNPITLEKASSVTFYPQSTSFVDGTSFSATVPDKNSDRLIIATSASPNITFEKITVDLGITAGTLQSLLIDMPSQGTNWINYDLRSFEQQLGVTSFFDTKMVLYFGELGLNPVSIIGVGEISLAKGLAQISNAATNDIKLKLSSSSVFLEIDFDASDNNVGVGTVSIEQDTQPIVFDLFSFGEKNGQRFNNAIYRAELEETSANSGTFTGTMEYAVINQLNQVDPAFIKSLRTIDEEIKFLVNDKLTDEKGINLAYSDVANVGITIGISSKTDITAHSGTVTLEKQTYRFGQPVVVLLTDPDLNTKHDVVDVYSVVDSPGSTADDTVGDTSGNILLEIRIKGFRYHRCTINGVEYGGLASTGFALVETGPGTGVFKGSFKMPSQICSEDRTRLISPAGGSIEASYFDFRDSSGQPREIGLTFPKPSSGSVLNIPKVEESAIIIKSTEIRDAFNRPVLQKSTVGQKLNFVTEISNNDQQSQSYSYIIQVRDQNNSIVDLRWINGKVDPAKKNIATILWEPILLGNYTVEIFVWDGIDSATPLTKKTEYAINVGSR